MSCRGFRGMQTSCGQSYLSPSEPSPLPPLLRQERPVPLAILLGGEEPAPIIAAGQDVVVVAGHELAGLTRHPGTRASCRPVPPRTVPLFSQNRPPFLPLFSMWRAP